MPVRISEIPGLQNTAINAPGMSGAAAGATGQALGSLASTIAGVSEAFAGQAQQVQKTVNATQISETRNALSEAYANFQVENQKEIDPDKRHANTMDFLNKQKAGMDSPKFSPYVRNSLTGHYDEFATRARIASIEDVANLSSKRAVMALNNGIENAKRTGDRQGIEANLGIARDAGVLLPEQEESILQDFDRNTQFLSARLQAEDSPQDAIESLESESFLSTNPFLYPEDRDSLLRFAKQQQQVKRGEEIELLDEAELQGRLSPVDIEAAEHLSAKDRASYRSSLEIIKAEDPISQQDYLGAWKITDNLRTFRSDPGVSDDQYRVMHAEAATLIRSRIPPSRQGDLKKELGYLSPAGRDTSEPSTKGDLSDLQSIGSGSINRAYDAGMYGDTSKDAPYESKERAARKAEDIRLQVKRFIASKSPPPTAQEVRSYVDTINGQAIDGDTPLVPYIPAPFAIDAQELRDILAIPGAGNNVAPGAGDASDLVLPPKP
jgi:hypothetical protein